MTEPTCDGNIISMRLENIIIWQARSVRFRLYVCVCLSLLLQSDCTGNKLNHNNRHHDRYYLIYYNGNAFIFPTKHKHIMHSDYVAQHIFVRKRGTGTGILGRVLFFRLSLMLISLI